MRGLPMRAETARGLVSWSAGMVIGTLLLGCGQGPPKEEGPSTGEPGQAAAPKVQAADDESLVLGDWHGESKVLAKNTPAKDEVVVWHIARGPAPGKLHITADKIVNGKAISMGAALEFNYDPAQKTIVCEIQPGVWKLTVKGNAMEGTLTLHDQTVFRRVTLEPSEKTSAGAVGTSGKELEWRWSKEKASLAYSIKQHLQDYEVERVQEKEYYTPINIRTKTDRKVIYSLPKGHESTVFTRWKDTLYVAEYSPIATGCEVVALDLKAGKQLWKARLEGIGATGHSKYLNLVNIETDGQRVIVSGNEAHGRYVEILDLRSGNTLANKKLDADPKSLFGG
jgi:hypothetical protein